MISLSACICDWTENTLETGDCFVVDNRSCYLTVPTELINEHLAANWVIHANDG